jgi:hypothetical protein
MKTTLKKLLVMTVIASALTLVLAACEPIEEGDLEQPPMEQPME